MVAKHSGILCKASRSPRWAGGGDLPLLLATLCKSDGPDANVRECSELVPSPSSGQSLRTELVASILQIRTRSFQAAKHTAGRATGKDGLVEVERRLGCGISPSF